MARRRTKHLALIAFILAIGVATPSVLALLIEENGVRAATGTDSNTGGDQDTLLDAPEDAIPSDDLSIENAENTENVENTENTTEDNTTGGEAVEDSPLSGEVHVDTAELFTKAIDSAAVSKITLDADIEMPSYTWLTRDLEIDLGGHRLSSANGNGVLLAYGGATVITGAEGSAVESTNGGVAIWVYGSSDPEVTNAAMLTIDEHVSIVTTDSDNRAYAIAFTPVGDNNNVSYGAKVVVKGTLRGHNGITIHGQISNYDNPATIVIEDGAEIIASDSSDGTAIYAAGYGDWTIGSADISGPLALGVKSGDFHFTNSRLTSTAAHVDSIDQNGDGIDVSGATIQIENNAIYPGAVNILIDGGTYTSEHSHVFYEYGNNTPTARTDGSALDSLKINSGTFRAAADMSIFKDVNPAAVTLTAGEYNVPVDAAYLSSSQKLVQNADGTWTIAANTTPTNPSDPDDPSSPGNPSDPDDPSKPDQKPDDQKPSTPDQKPGANSPDTGHYSPQAVAAVTSTAAAVIAGFLVATGLIIRHIIRRRHLEVDEIAEISILDRSKRSGKTAKRASKSTKSSKSAKSSKSSLSSKGTKSSKSAAKSTSGKSTVSRSAKPKSARKK